MDYTQDTTKHVKDKHFSYDDRRELHGILSNKSVHPKLQLEVAHFLKIKLRKSYRVHSRTNHLAFYTPKFF